MSRRNIAWLIVVVGAGVLVGIVAGWVWGLVTAGATLLISEAIERDRRRRRRAARGAAAVSPLRATLRSRRDTA